MLPDTTPSPGVIPTIITCNTKTKCFARHVRPAYAHALLLPTCLSHVQAGPSTCKA
jgi:hypothetical protein